MSKLHLSKNSKLIVDEIYARKNDKREPETPEQLFLRVARFIAKADAKYKHKSFTDKLAQKYSKNFSWISKTKEFSEHTKHDKGVKQTEDDFFELLTSLDFLPSSPMLWNAHAQSPVLTSCTILSIDDSIPAIFEAVQKTAMLQQSGAGTGFNFSSIRPKGDLIKSSQGAASGPLSFMNIFDAATECIRQGGRERGANAAVLRIDHPDIKEFILARQKGQLKNFNTYVAVTDKFMDAVEKQITYNLINPHTGKAVAKQSAHEIFRMIAESVWKCGNPGIVFIDAAEKKNPVQLPIEAVSPTGELVAHANSAVVMGSINLSQMVKDKAIDYERHKKRVHQAIHFLDNALDLSSLPPEIEQATLAHRQIGLGVMGFADLLVQLKVRYSSDKAVQIAEELMSFINTQSLEASRELAKKRGVFPGWKKSIYARKNDKVRNSARTVIAPTSMISAIAGCSQGIEPLYGIVFTRTINKKKLLEVNEHFIVAMKEENTFSADLVDKIKAQGSLHGLFIPAWTKRIFVVASEIPHDWHVKMQAAFQKHCDNGVAKVIAFAPDSDMIAVESAIKQAHKSSCVSFTGYRYAGRQEHIISFGTRHGILTGQLCPSCNIALEREANIEICRNCGYGIIE